MSRTITDSRTNTTSRICRTYRTTDGLAKLHITADRRVWLDCTDGGPGRMSHVGTLGDGMKMSSENARRAANM